MGGTFPLGRFTDAQRTGPSLSGSHGASGFVILFFFFGP